MNQTAKSEMPQLRVEKTACHHNAIQPSVTHPSQPTGTSTSLISLPPTIRAMIATFSTAELLEKILSYLAPIQNLKAKATCHSFHNAIESSPTIRRSMSTFLRLGQINESDLFQSDAGGEVVFPVPGVDVLAFFYPEDGGRRLFVRFAVEPEAFARLRKSEAFRGLEVVDPPLVDAKIGWHCGCFEGGRGEAGLCSGGEREGGGVQFGEMFEAMEEKHEGEVERYEHGGCESVRKVWLDGLWERSREMRC